MSPKVVADTNNIIASIYFIIVLSDGQLAEFLPNMKKLLTLLVYQ
jgi:hypothetical protein